MKTLTWEAAAQKVDTLADKLGKGIDEGIKDTVITLLVLGFTTRQSCEGHLERALATPWVDLTVTWSSAHEHLRQQERAELRRLDKALAAGQPLDYTRFRQISNKLHQLWLPELERLLAYLVGFAQDRPVTRHSLILDSRPGGGRLVSQSSILLPLDDEAKRREVWECSRREMRDFTTYLKKQLD